MTAAPLPLRLLTLDDVAQFRLVDGQYVEHARVPLTDLLASDAPAL